jgi:hypothetical protein
LCSKTRRQRCDVVGDQRLRLCRPSQGVVDLFNREIPPLAPACRDGFHGAASALGRSVRRRREVLEVRDELGEEERPVASGVRVQDRGRGVDELEPDDEVGVSKVLADERAAPVGGEVDAVCARELDRLRERRHGVEAQRSVRLNGKACIAGCGAEDAFRKRAAEAVARADEDDLERSPDSLRDRVALLDPVEVRQRVEPYGLRSTPILAA